MRQIDLSMAALSMLVVCSTSLPAAAQSIVERSAETRFQLDVRVPEAPLLQLLPAGWRLNVAIRGAAKDANLRVVFIDRLTIHGPDGRPVGDGSNRLVYLIAPVTDPDGVNGQLVIGGLTEDPEDAPGPFGVYLRATNHSMRRSVSTGEGAVLETQDWTFAAATGERLEMHITFERGVGNRGNASETRFTSAANPGTHQISQQEQVLDILRNVTTTPPDRVRAFSFVAGGGRYAALFDGSEQIVSWDNIVWLNRTVLTP